MKRFTERDYWNKPSVKGVDRLTLERELPEKQFNKLDAALNRLAAYEDIGLTPEDIKTMYKEYEVHI